jgi:hypothetical protein
MQHQLNKLAYKYNTKISNSKTEVKEMCGINIKKVEIERDTK